MRSKAHSDEGSALLVVLGILAILTLLVFAYAFSARTERYAARHARDALVARQNIDTVVSLVMAREVPLHLLGTFGSGDNLSLARFAGRPDFTSLGPVLGGNDEYLSRHAFTSCLYDDHGCGTCRNFLDNVSTNFIPAALHDELTSLSADWIPIESVDEDTGDTICTNALYAYAVVDLSGFLDVHHLSSNQVARLAQTDDDIADARLFLDDRRAQTAPALGSGIDSYVSYRDLVVRNRGLATSPRHLLHFSCDPAPDVTITNGAVYSDFGDANRAADLVPKLDLNGWTNGFTGDLRQTADLERHYASSPFRAWLSVATNRLSYCGFAAP